MYTNVHTLLYFMLHIVMYMLYIVMYIVDFKHIAALDDLLMAIL